MWLTPLKKIGGLNGAPSPGLPCPGRDVPGGGRERQQGGVGGDLVQVVAADVDQHGGGGLGAELDGEGGGGAGLGGHQRRGVRQKAWGPNPRNEKARGQRGTWRYST